MNEVASQQVVVVTGLSGAGKSTALNALEDLGYYCVDNLPPNVIASTLDALASGGVAKVALGIDARIGAFIEEADKIISALNQRALRKLTVLYLDASEELLARRFSATRRPHPLTSDSESQVSQVLLGVRREKKLLIPLRALASMILETSNFTVHDLRREILTSFDQAREERSQVHIRVQSFGFKFGPPLDADMVLDVRFLPNPYFVEELRVFSGKDEAVSSYVLENLDAQIFLDKSLALLTYCLPRFVEEGKSYITIAIGCTGGRHRSVALSEFIARSLSDTMGYPVDAVHRDMGQAEHLSPGRRVSSN